MQKVTDPAILAQLNSGAPSPRPAQQRPVAPAPESERVIGAPPVPTQVQQQQMQNDQTRIGLAIQGEERQQRQFEQGNVSEQQAAFLLDRVGGGIDDLNFIMKNMPGGKGAPGAVDAVLYNSFGPNSIVTRGMTESGRKAVEDVQLDILDALLTLGTGAAYNAEQLQGQRAAYFPQFNDDEQTVALKRRRLERLFNNAVVRAGPLGERLSQYRGQFLGTGDETPVDPMQGARKPTTQDQFPLGVRLGMDGGDDEPFDRARYLQERFGVDPGQETRLLGIWNANLGNPNVTPEMVARMYQDVGLNPPDQATLVDAADRLRKGGLPSAGINTAAAEKAYLQGLDTIIQRAGFNPEGQGATFANTLRQGAAFEGFDEITGLVNAVAEGLQGNDPIAGYRTGRDITRRMIERGDEANPVTGLAGRILGSLPTGAVGSVGRVGSVGSAARVGAAEGAVVGFNQGEGLQGSVLGAAVGAPTGAGIGAGFQAGGNALLGAMRRNQPQVDPTQARQIAEAGERRGVPTRMVDLDPRLQNRRGQIQQTEQGRSALRAAEQEDLAAIETALIRDLGGRAGTQRTEAAELVQQGVTKARQDLRDQAQIEYRAASAQAGNMMARPTQALAQIDQQIGELTANGARLNAKEIAYLQDLKADLTQANGLSIDNLRAQRTGLRSKLENAGVYSTDFERRLGLVLDEASKDLEASLQAFPQALARYKKADGLWRQQAEFGEKVGDLLLGKDGNLAPGQAADRLMGWAKKDPARLSGMLKEVDDATKEEVRALVASQLGRAANGNFSLAAFLTQTSDGRGGGLSPKAIRALFGNDGVKAIEDLRILSQAKVDAASARNTSNTGSLVEQARGSFRRLMLGMFGFNAMAEPMTGTLVGGATVMGGELINRLGTERTVRLLLNPNVTGWLRRLPNTNNPQAINRSFAGLRSIASRSPVMMTDIQALERALFEAVNDNGVSRAVAEDQQPQQNQ